MDFPWLVSNDVIGFLRQYCGLKYWLNDPAGDDVGFSIEKGITFDELEAIIREWSEPFRAQMRRESARRMRTMLGGPQSGKPHGRIYGDVMTFHLERGKWAAYYVLADGRAPFAGYATSRRKARLLALRKMPPMDLGTRHA